MGTAFDAFTPLSHHARTDVFIIVKTEIITEKYIRHYERGMNEQGD